MGNHRADRRTSSRRRSEDSTQKHAGRRVAGREAREATAEAAVVRRAAEPAAAPQLPPVTVELQAVAASEATTTGSLRPAVPGKRRAVRSASPARNPLLRAIPSMPVVVGVATLAVAAGGVLTSNDQQLVGTDPSRLAAPNAATGASGSGAFSAAGRSAVVSRDSDRDALDDASGADLVQEVEKQAEQRNVALGNLADAAEKEAKQINLNRWVLPIDAGAYRLTARYGEYGLWASYHTGLDFAAPTGTPLKAIANGVITSVGYDGAYGEKTVITLEDGTEIWYCHQTAYAVSEGDTVVAGQVIGYVGSTGNTTGPHLHLEVRPGGGDPLDPDAAMRANGIAP